jgi:hypothetical protein
MPKLDGSRLEGKGPCTGRGLGKCFDLPKEEKLKKLGKGLAKKRKHGCGEGKRLNNLMIEPQK